ncbi:phosphatidylinositol-binding protein scs2 [Ophidiomyces ophidiicola]|nr:phosphatidylinositol-binding protein scs2 [Ophidiomyces ophidiicola]
MSVEIEPAELGFQRPFDQEVSQILHLRNPNSDPVAFKVKTTAPRRYCVRPNSGRIEPGKHVEVQVLLQAMKDEPPLDTKCRDKFLVQSVAVSADKEFSNVTAIWHDVEQSAKNTIQERKIRVNYLAPADAPSTNGAPAEDDASALHASPANPKFETPSVPTRAAPVAAAAGIAEPPIPPPNLKSEPQELDSASASQNTKKVRQRVTFSSAGEDVESQLEDARAQIQALKQQVADSELRQRKAAPKQNASEMATLQQQSHPSGGVPVQMVAGLCLLSFLLAYFFF